MAERRGSESPNLSLDRPLEKPVSVTPIPNLSHRNEQRDREVQSRDYLCMYNIATSSGSGSADNSETQKEEEEHITDGASKRKECPLDAATSLSRVTYHWASSLMAAGAKRPLEEAQLWEVSNVDSSDHLLEMVTVAWEKEQRRAQNFREQRSNAAARANGWLGSFCSWPFTQLRYEQASLFRATISVFCSKQRAAHRMGCLLPLKSAAGIGQALALGALVDHMSSGRSGGPRTWYLSFALAGLGVLLFHLHHLFFFEGCRVGTQLRTAFTAAIYRKTLTLSLSALGRFSRGHVSSLASTDLEAFQVAGWGAHYLWAAPLEAVVVLAVGVTHLGPAFAAGLALLLVLVPLQAHCGRLPGRQLRSTVARTHTEGRLQLTAQAVLKARSLKVAGGELLFAHKVENARELELRSVGRFNLLRAAHEAAFLFTSDAVVGLFTFTVHVLLLGRPLRAGQAVTALALFHTVQASMAHFFVLAVESCSSALVSLQRIQRFLEVGDVDDEEEERSPVERKPMGSAPWRARRSERIKSTCLDGEDPDGLGGSSSSSSSSSLDNGSETETEGEFERRMIDLLPWTDEDDAELRAETEARERAEATSSGAKMKTRVLQQRQSSACAGSGSGSAGGHLSLSGDDDSSVDPFRAQLDELLDGRLVLSVQNLCASWDNNGGSDGDDVNEDKSSGGVELKNLNLNDDGDDEEDQENGSHAKSFLAPLCGRRDGEKASTQRRRLSTRRRSSAAATSTATTRHRKRGARGGQIHAHTQVLSGVSVSCRVGEVVAVVGPKAVGKSSLLLAILGELPATSSSAASRSLSRSSPRSSPPSSSFFSPLNSSSFGDTINNSRGCSAVTAPLTTSAKHRRPRVTAFAPQEPFILGGCTLRENILFGAKFDAAKFSRVVEACQLKPDLAALASSGGDLTVVSEVQAGHGGGGGVALSAGQRAKVGLARVCYQVLAAEAEAANEAAAKGAGSAVNADVLVLLDDPLAAVDPAVGRRLFRRVVVGPRALLRRCGVVLVTRQRRFLRSRHVTSILALENQQQKQQQQQQQQQQNQGEGRGKGGGEGPGVVVAARGTYAEVAPLLTYLGDTDEGEEEDEEEEEEKEEGEEEEEEEPSASPSGNHVNNEINNEVNNECSGDDDDDDAAEVAGDPFGLFTRPDPFVGSSAQRQEGGEAAAALVVVRSGDGDDDDDDDDDDNDDGDVANEKEREQGREGGVWWATNCGRFLQAGLGLGGVGRRSRNKRRRRRYPSAAARGFLVFGLLAFLCVAATVLAMALNVWAVRWAGADNTIDSDEGGEDYDDKNNNPYGGGGDGGGSVGSRFMSGRKQSDPAWVAGCAVLLLGSAASSLAFATGLVRVCATASESLHEEALWGVLRSKLPTDSCFDHHHHHHHHHRAIAGTAAAAATATAKKHHPPTATAGSVLDCFRKDVGCLDLALPLVFHGSVRCAVWCLTTLAFASVTNPWVLLAVAPLLGTCGRLRHYAYLTIREVKRLNGASPSSSPSSLPSSLLLEAMTGLASIHSSDSAPPSHRSCSLFLEERFHALMNEERRARFALEAANRWLGYRVDALCCALLAAATFLAAAVYESPSSRSIDPGLLGLSLLFVAQLSSGLGQRTVHTCDELENLLESAGRLVECAILPREAPLTFPTDGELRGSKTHGKSKWPSAGKIVVSNLTVRHERELASNHEGGGTTSGSSRARRRRKEGSLRSELGHHSSSRPLAAAPASPLTPLPLTSTNSSAAAAALEGVSFTIEAGSRVGVVEVQRRCSPHTSRGQESGGALVHALLRLVEPSEGSMELDGVNVCSVGLHALRKGVSVVTDQPPVLFPGSLRSNLDPSGLHSDKELWSALREVFPSDGRDDGDGDGGDARLMTEALPEGLDTLVSESSDWCNFVGERQLKLSLVRAILEDTKVLILDGTAAAAFVKGNRSRLLEDRTVLVVARGAPDRGNLAAIVDCDQVLVFDSGRLVEDGNPHLLLSADMHHNENSTADGDDDAALNASNSNDSVNDGLVNDRNRNGSSSSSNNSNNVIGDVRVEASDETEGNHKRNAGEKEGGVDGAEGKERRGVEENNDTAGTKEERWIEEIRLRERCLVERGSSSSSSSSSSSTYSTTTFSSTSRFSRSTTAMAVGAAAAAGSRSGSVFSAMVKACGAARAEALRGAARDAWTRSQQQQQTRKNRKEKNESKQKYTGKAVEWNGDEREDTWNGDEEAEEELDEGEG